MTLVIENATPEDSCRTYQMRNIIWANKCQYYYTLIEWRLSCLKKSLLRLPTRCHDSNTPEVHVVIQVVKREAAPIGFKSGILCLPGRNAAPNLLALTGGAPHSSILENIGGTTRHFQLGLQTVVPGGSYRQKQLIKETLIQINPRVSFLH